MSNFIQHEACPSCGSRDNLARYDDGGAWCFGCGYWEKATNAGFLRAPHTGIPKGERVPGFPSGSGYDYDRVCLAWISKYDLFIDELISRNIFWSPNTQQLIFPFWKDGELVFWQARNFSPNAFTKCLNYGNKSNAELIYKKDTIGKTKNIVIVEDPISAIKVARQIDSYCLFGSTMPLKKIAELAPQYDTIIVWLDSDKFEESNRISSQFASLCKKTLVVVTDDDPKTYTNEEIFSYTS